ncbi:MAG: hypothetical protein ACOX1Z_02645 [Candidatus Ratteibacteria bacterium]
MLGRGEDFIFLNSVPPKKKLKKGESLDLFMIFVPITKDITKYFQNSLKKSRIKSGNINKKGEYMGILEEDRKRIEEEEEIRAKGAFKI